MKSISYFLSFAFVILLCISCEDKGFLDETATTDLNVDVVFSDSTYTAGFLTGIYTDVGFDTDPGRFSNGYSFFGGLQCASDEAEFKVNATITSDALFATGTVNPVVISSDVWQKCYQNIRSVNVLFKNIDRTPLSSSKKKMYKAEARFLRAWYYSVLLKHYGGIPVIRDTVYTSYEGIDPKRNTFKECVDYIVSECDIAAQDLIYRPAGRDYGHAGAGACRALKARVLLMAASPLFNGSDFAPDENSKELLGYPSYDKERWRIAKEAAQDLIQSGVYSLYVDNDGDSDYPGERGLGYYKIFFACDWATDGATRGTIFEYQGKKSHRNEHLLCPPSRGGTSAGGYPYQDLVDAYPLINGSSFDWSNSVVAASPYTNRDPRLYNSIIIDQTPIQNGSGKTPINTYLNEDGNPFDQDAVHSGTPTGYYIRKFIHRNASSNWIAETTQSRPLLRYAETLLNYAEAANEYEGPSQEIYTALTSIRDRAGILPGGDSLYGFKPNMTQAEMRETIRNERRIELAFEGFRFWDVRRWMIVEETDGKMMTGLEVRKVGSKKTYTSFNVRQHIFRKAMYFWPIPNSEVAKSPTLVQNPYY